VGRHARDVRRVSIPPDGLGSFRQREEILSEPCTEFDQSQSHLTDYAHLLKGLHRMRQVRSEVSINWLGSFRQGRQVGAVHVRLRVSIPPDWLASFIPTDIVSDHGSDGEGFCDMSQSYLTG